MLNKTEIDSGYLADDEDEVGGPVGVPVEASGYVLWSVIKELGRSWSELKRKVREIEVQVGIHGLPVLVLQGRVLFVFFGMSYLGAVLTLVTLRDKFA